MWKAAEKNPMICRGYSRDHRPDCEQLVIALIVNSEGFPFSYETFDGNRADVSTMETILRMCNATAILLSRRPKNQNGRRLCFS
jgi:transposase